MAPSKSRYGAMEPENPAAAQTYQRDDEDAEEYSELSSLLADRTSHEASSRDKWGWLRSTRVRVGLLGVMMVSMLLAVSFDHGVRGSRRAVVSSARGTKAKAASLMATSSPKKKDVHKRRHGSKFHFSSLDSSVDGETTLTAYGRLYKNESDCLAQTAAYADSDWSLTVTSGTCTQFIPTGEYDGTDASYLMMTCDDDVMMLYYFADSECTLYDSSFEYTANSVTCVEGIDDDSYMRVYASSCDGTVDETNEFFAYDYTLNDERKYTISHLYETQMFFHQQLHRAGYEVTSDGLAFAERMAPKFRSALDPVLSMWDGDDSETSKAVQQDLIDSFTDPVVFQWILDYKPKHSNPKVVKKSPDVLRRRKDTRQRNRRAGSRRGSKGSKAGAYTQPHGRDRQLLGYLPQDTLNTVDSYRPAHAPLVVHQASSGVPSIQPAHRMLASSPTKAPTTAPTKAPTIAPTKAPTKAPTVAPTKKPTIAPTPAPTTDYSSWETVCAYVGVSFSLLFWSASYSILICADDDDSGWFYSYCWGSLVGCEISVSVAVGASYTNGDLSAVPGKVVALGKSIDVASVSVTFEADYVVTDDFDDDDLEDFSVGSLIPDVVAVGASVSAGEGVSYFSTALCEAEAWDDDDVDDDDWKEYLTDDATAVPRERRHGNKQAKDERPHHVRTQAESAAAVVRQRISH